MFAFSFPFWNAPAVGDMFVVTAGSDHSQDTCTNKFNNLVHFRGFPYVTQPITAV